MNIRNLVSLFNGVNFNENEIKKSNRNALWSSDSESSDDDRDKKKKVAEEF